MAKVAGTVPVSIKFQSEDVLTDDSFYKKVTPYVTVGIPRFEKDKLKLAIIKDALMKKKRIKLGRKIKI